MVHYYGEPGSRDALVIRRCNSMALQNPPFSRCTIIRTAVCEGIDSVALLATRRLDDIILTTSYRLSLSDGGPRPCMFTT